MHAFDLHRSSPLRAIVLVIVSAHLVLLPPLVPAAWAHGLAPADATYDDLMVHAERKRAAGAYAESADLYGQAYRARPEAERADAIGEIMVRSAMADYDLASPSESDLVLLEAEAGLLEDFLAARREAQAVARAKKARKVPEVPQDLVDELERLKAHIAELREAERKVAEEPEPEPAPALEPEPELEPLPPSEPGRAPIPKSDAAILGVGLASFVGGAALIGVGSSSFVQSGKTADAALDALDAEPEYTNAQRQTYRDGLEDWQQEWRNFSTAFLVSGAVLAAAGMGLTSWGIVRMRKHRSRAGSRAALAPALGRRHVGVWFTAAF